MRQVTFAVGLTALGWSILRMMFFAVPVVQTCGIARPLSVLGLMILLGAAPAPPSGVPVKRRVIRLEHPKQPDAPRSLVASTGSQLGFKQEDLTKNSSIADVSNGQVRAFRLWNGQSARFTVERFIETHSGSLGLGEGDSLETLSTHSGAQGVQHLRLRQKHAGVPVENAFFSLTVVEGFVVSGRGSIAKGLNVSAAATVSAATALQTAMSKLAQSWEWITNPAVAAPTGTLFIHSKDSGNTSFSFVWQDRHADFDQRWLGSTSTRRPAPSSIRVTRCIATTRRPQAPRWRQGGLLRV